MIRELLVTPPVRPDAIETSWCFGCDVMKSPESPVVTCVDTLCRWNWRWCENGMVVVVVFLLYVYHTWPPYTMTSSHQCVTTEQNVAWLPIHNEDNGFQEEDPVQFFFFFPPKKSNSLFHPWITNGFSEQPTGFLNNQSVYWVTNRFSE